MCRLTLCNYTCIMKCVLLSSLDSVSRQFAEQKCSLKMCMSIYCVFYACSLPVLASLVSKNPETDAGHHHLGWEFSSPLWFKWVLLQYSPLLQQCREVRRWAQKLVQHRVIRHAQKKRLCSRWEGGCAWELTIQTYKQDRGACVKGA